MEKYSKQVAVKFGLNTRVLSDRGNQAASRFGLVFTLSEELREVYRSFGIDLERFNGDDSWTLPVPARFLVDAGGVIRHVDADPDYTVRPEPTELIDLIKSL